MKLRRALVFAVIPVTLLLAGWVCWRPEGVIAHILVASVLWWLAPVLALTGVFTIWSCKQRPRCLSTGQMIAYLVMWACLASVGLFLPDFNGQVALPAIIQRIVAVPNNVAVGVTMGAAVLAALSWIVVLLQNGVQAISQTPDR